MRKPMENHRLLFWNVKMQGMGDHWSPTFICDKRSFAGRETLPLRGVIKFPVGEAFRLPFLCAICVWARGLLPPLSRSPVSLRLGHARVLTVHRTVIHYARAASLPPGGRLICNLPKLRKRASVRLAEVPFLPCKGMKVVGLGVFWVLSDRKISPTKGFLLFCGGFWRIFCSSLIDPLSDFLL